MSNPLYDSMKDKSIQQQNQQINPMQMVQQLKSNPIQFLKNMGFNIPNGVDFKNPQSIINSLIQSGQINNNRYQQAMQMMKGINHK